MSDKPLPSAGIGTGTTLTTTLTGVFTSLAAFLSAANREAFINLIPFLTPALAWGILWVYNRFVEPPELSSLRGKLESDLKRLKKIRKDKSLTPEQKKEFDDDYMDTQKRISRIGRDFADGKYQKTA